MLKSYSMSGRVSSDVVIPVVGKQGKTPACECPAVSATEHEFL